MPNLFQAQKIWKKLKIETSRIMLDMEETRLFRMKIKHLKAEKIEGEIAFDIYHDCKMPN
jgi:hypothetical protein